ncbi:molybdopterin-guanine dinucleotide biosynthesis protein B [Rhodobacterales bacterium HKCCE2091]|nr:molybdopterin-guanine dinucleotide biosynthesis protein B [Rhodobacterales bacterium HKCCE2091]
MKVIGVVGWKDSGKTGLVERLVRHLTGAGLRVSTLKHAHHGFDVDRPGTDSFRHRAAGAAEVLIASGHRWALMSELRGRAEPSLDDLLERLGPCDLAIAEGWKAGSHPRIEAHRAATGLDPLALSDPGIRAVASDAAPEVPCPVLDLNDIAAIARFVRADLGL